MTEQKGNTQQGSGMVELLVAMIIVATGVIGLGALHLQATRASSASIYTSQAVWVVNDIVSVLQGYRSDDQDKNQRLFTAINKSADPVKCLSTPPTGEFADLFKMIWASCPSTWRLNAPTGEVNPTVNAIASPLDWFANPEISIRCRTTPLTANFFVPDDTQPLQVPAQQPPDCLVVLTWAERLNIADRDSLRPTQAGVSKNIAQYSMAVQLGRLRQ
jgi:Tfp pilus assembly protein PilV